MTLGNIGPSVILPANHDGNTCLHGDLSRPALLGFVSPRIQPEPFFFRRFPFLSPRSFFYTHQSITSMTIESSSGSLSPSQEPQEDGAYGVHSAWTNDSRNPYNWPLWRKWMNMVISYWVTILVGINATSFTTAAEALSADFNVSNSFFEFSFFAVTSWNATAAIVPLATLPMLETFGFRIGYTVSKHALFHEYKVKLTLIGSLYSVLPFHYTPVRGTELRNTCCLSTFCWCIRWDGSKCCGWHCSKFVFY